MVLYLAVLQLRMITLAARHVSDAPHVSDAMLR